MLIFSPRQRAGYGGCRLDTVHFFRAWIKRGDAHTGASPRGALMSVNRVTIVSEPVYNFLEIQTQVAAVVNPKEADVLRWPRTHRSP
jgi:hypothetical protein